MLSIAAMKRNGSPLSLNLGLHTLNLKVDISSVPNDMAI